MADKESKLKRVKIELKKFQKTEENIKEDLSKIDEEITVTQTKINEKLAEVKEVKARLVDSIK